MKPDTLDALNDDELRALIERAQGLLRQRDEDRKAKALGDAKAILASVGLSLKDLGGKAKGKPAKSVAYQGGHQYQHPTNKTLTWNAKGQKPRWLRELEAAGERAVEMSELR
jgi:DNA-binding protein H-NS